MNGHHRAHADHKTKHHAPKKHPPKEAERREDEVPVNDRPPEVWEGRIAAEDLPPVRY